MSSISMWEELSDSERKDMLDVSNKSNQQILLAGEQDHINMNKGLIEQMKQLINKRITKEDYNKSDQETVELALTIIKNCEAAIKESEKEILLLVKYPCGSKQRPSLILRKEYNG